VFGIRDNRFQHRLEMAPWRAMVLASNRSAVNKTRAGLQAVVDSRSRSNFASDFQIKLVKSTGLKRRCRRNQRKITGNSGFRLVSRRTESSSTQPLKGASSWTGLPLLPAHAPAARGSGIACTFRRKARGF